MTECNNCGQEIKWKYNFAEYMKLKKQNPSTKNTPLNMDDTPHICMLEEKETLTESKEVPLKETKSKYDEHIDRRCAVIVAKDILVASGKIEQMDKGTMIDALTGLAIAIECYIKWGDKPHDTS